VLQKQHEFQSMDIRHSPGGSESFKLIGTVLIESSSSIYYSYTSTFGSINVFFGNVTSESSSRAHPA
jgi:hypothetical protein